MIDNKKLLGNDNDIFQIKEVLEKSLDNKWTQEFVYLLRKFFYIEYWSNVEKNERYTIQMIQEVLKKHLDFLDEDRGTEEVMRKFRAMLPYLQQLFEMFLLAIGYDYEKVTLKNILLSGDWIKLEIYPKVNKLWPECRFVSLGGATEAAIWSVYYEVHILDEPWTSIPYGRPLANQLLRVVNNKGKDSPVGVPGELWIGGYGVAEGYVNEEKLTQERFVKIDGIRWYKTGDKAQYFQDGNVQFLGRLDDQVKVNGYRIELGEIENVIKRAECIDDAIAMTVETNGKKEIVAAVVEKYEKWKEGNTSDSFKERVYFIIYGIN